MRKKQERGELGQGLVEFAIVFPLLVFFLFAIVEAGLGFQRQATLQHAVREGARYGALRDNADVGAYVQQRTSDQSHGLVELNDVVICFTDMDGDTQIGAGDAIDVQVIYAYQPSFLKSAAGLFGAIVPSSFTIDVTGSARLEVALDDPNPGNICS